MQNFEKKVVRIQYNDVYAKDIIREGIVWQQKDVGDNKTEFHLILLDGTELANTFKNDKIVKISAMRIDPNLRQALIECCKAKQTQQKFLDNFWKQKAALDQEVARTKKVVSECSGRINMYTFEQEVENLFRTRFRKLPDGQYFFCSAIDSGSITISHMANVKKHASPSRYSFISEEYDRTLHVEENSKDYKEFCQKYAPVPIPEIVRNAASVTTSANIGDKDTLIACRDYTFALKYGLSKKSLEQIEKMLNK